MLARLFIPFAYFASCWTTLVTWQKFCPKWYPSGVLLDYWTSFHEMLENGMSLKVSVVAITNISWHVSLGSSTYWIFLKKTWRLYLQWFPTIPFAGSLLRSPFHSKLKWVSLKTSVCYYFDKKSRRIIFKQEACLECWACCFNISAILHTLTVKSESLSKWSQDRLMALI